MARREEVMNITTVERGKTTLRVFDRINVDDVYMHLVRRELYRLVTGQDQGVDIPPSFKDYLLDSRLSVGS